MTAALILAAGNVSEEDGLGPMANVGEVSSIKRILLVFRQAGVKKIVVVSGFGAEALEKHCSHFGVVFLRNYEYENGEMLTSAIIGLEYLKDKCDKVFITPANVPLFSAETVESMDNKEGHVIIPMHKNKTGHPLLLSRSLFNRVMEYSGPDGLEGALSGEGVKRVFFEVPDAGIIAYAHNNADLNRIIENHSLRRIKPEMKVMLSGEKGFFGPGALQLLNLTSETGSLRQAAQHMGISYSKAWKMITDIERQLGFPILSSKVGGKSGGGSELTDECRAFMARYDAFMSECEGLIKAAFDKHFS